MQYYTDVSLGEYMDNKLFSLTKMMLIGAFICIEAGFFYIQPKSPVVVVPLGVMVAMIMLLLSAMCFAQAFCDKSIPDDYRQFSRTAGILYLAGFLLLIATPFIS